jgi:hypothetical protein
VPETVVASDQWGQIIYHNEWNSLELRWLPSTANATDSDLRSTLQTFAREAVDRSPKTLIVDTKEFRHTWGDDIMQWRDAEIIPLYNQAGVTKFAFIASLRGGGDRELRHRGHRQRLGDHYQPRSTNSGQTNRQPRASR